MYYKAKLTIIIVTFFLILISALPALAAPSDISLTVGIGSITCNNNDVCDTGETEANCSNDCGCDNDGTCELDRGETVTNCPNDCVTTIPESGSVVLLDTVPPKIYDLVIIPTQRSVRINWRTNEKTISNLYWGKTTDYELGVISKTNYSINHSTLIESLIPNTIYHFITELRDSANNIAKSVDQAFKTLDFPDDVPPANVNNFEAKENEQEIELSWNNPPDPDFQEIRIVRNNQFYPKDPNDGEIIYQGGAESFVDEDVFDEDYFYTIFAYDGARNYSSGAIIKAKPQKAPKAPVMLPTDRPTLPSGITIPLPSEIKKIVLEDIVFTQDGEEVEVKDGSILADTGKPMKISIAYDKLPEVLKTVIVSLKRCNPNEQPLSDSTGPLSGRRAESPESLTPSSNGLESRVQRPGSTPCSSFSFLLKVDPQKTEYSATIISPYQAGIYPIAVSILDFQHQELKELEGNLLLRETIVPIQDQNINIWAIIGRIIVLFIGFGSLSLLLRWLILRLTEKLKPKNEKVKTTI